MVLAARAGRRQRHARNDTPTSAVSVAYSHDSSFVRLRLRNDRPAGRCPGPECPAPQHLVLQRKHAGRRLVDLPHEGDRSLQDRLQPLAILNARRRVLVLDDQMRVGDVERQQLARGELMIEPVDRPVLQIGERIVPRRARQLVLAEHDLLLPRVQLIGRVVETACRRSSRRAPSSGRHSPTRRRLSRRRPAL